MFANYPKGLETLTINNIQYILDMKFWSMGYLFVFH